jgi:hypothetical protein
MIERLLVGKRGRLKREMEEFRRLERICVDVAEQSTMELERVGLLKVAEDCRHAAAELEAQFSALSKRR